MTSARRHKVEPNPAIRVPGEHVRVDEHEYSNYDCETNPSTEDPQLPAPLPRLDKPLQSFRSRSSTPSKKLQFVNLTKDPEIERKSNANRWLVRSTAINHALKERGSGEIEANSRRKRQKPNSQIDKRAAKESADATRSDTSARAISSSDGLPLPQSLEAAMPDPFSSFAVNPSVPDLHVASSYFKLVSQPNYLYYKMLKSPNADKEIICASLRAPVLYHAMLYGVIAQHFGMDKPLLRSMSSALMHERQAITLAQEELNRNGTASEELVFATALMSITELIVGSQERGSIHLLGLIQMLNLHGGVEKYRNPLLRNFLYWFCSMGYLPKARTSSAEERIMPVELPQVAPILRPLRGPTKPGQIFSLLGHANVVESRLAGILQDIRDATLAPSGQSLPKDFLQAPKSLAHFNAASHELINWCPLETDTERPVKPGLSVDIAAALAGKLFVDLVRRRTGATSVELSLKLQSELIQLEGRYHSDYLGFVLWILFMGGVFAKERIRKWYLHQIDGVAGHIKSSWEQTRNVLRRFLWTDHVCEAPCKKLWEDTFHDLS